jgi:hypothetical protein
MEGHGQGASDSRYAAVVAITGKRGRLHDRGGGSFHCSGENNLREAHLGIHLQSRDRCRVIYTTYKRANQIFFTATKTIVHKSTRALRLYPLDEIKRRKCI